MTTSTAGPTLSSATVHCKTSTLKGNVVSEPGGWPILAWFQQSTYWCYNGKTVTSHKTTYRAGVTASGTLAGLSYTGIVAGTEGWHCYVAAGSHVNCSGNTEYAEGDSRAASRTSTVSPATSTSSRGRTTRASTSTTKRGPRSRPFRRLSAGTADGVRPSPTPYQPLT